MSLTRVPLTIAARNEERALGPCLDSYLAAIAVAEGRLSLRIEPLVVLDDTVDASAEVAASRGIRAVTSHGGKVEAQRRGQRPGPFQLFGDADILVRSDTLAELCATMLGDPRVWVAFPDKRPLEPRRGTRLARALHVYNARRGFSSARAWFSGKLFAIRALGVPDAGEIARRAQRLEPSRFYDFSAPLRVDDVYISRRVAHEHGAAALRETRGLVWFRAPETWLGMYRYYRRMRREIERVERLFPELGPSDTREPDLLAAATASDRRAYATFGAALAACRVAYRLDRLGTEWLKPGGRDPWPAIAETKRL